MIINISLGFQSELYEEGYRKSTSDESRFYSKFQGDSFSILLHQVLLRISRLYSGELIRNWERIIQVKFIKEWGAREVTPS